MIEHKTIVAFVLGYLARSYGGPPNMAIHLGQAMEKYGVTATWWATATDEEKKELAYLGSNAFLFSTSFPHTWFRSSALLGKLKEYGRYIDLYHLNQIWDYPIYVGARIARKAQKPYIVTPHGILVERWRYSGLKKGLYLRTIALPILNHASCLHAVAKEEILGFEDLDLRAPFTIVPNGVDLWEYAEMPPIDLARRTWPGLEPGPLVLYLGRLSPEKGLDQLIIAWESVSKMFPAAKLIIAGPDFRNQREALESRIRRIGLQSSILMPGLLSGLDKKAALALADVYVQPSYSEAFSTSVLEALCCKKPCLITTACNFPEVAEVGAGEVVELGAQSLGLGLVKLLSLTDRERQAMGEKGRDLVITKYTWDIAARKMLTVYRCILDKKPIPLYPEPLSLPGL